MSMMRSLQQRERAENNLVKGPTDKRRGHGGQGQASATDMQGAVGPHPYQIQRVRQMKCAPTVVSSRQMGLERCSVCSSSTVACACASGLHTDMESAQHVSRVRCVSTRESE
eukprot:2269169-Pyramimonas_sp.AAC.2